MGGQVGGLNTMHGAVFRLHRGPADFQRCGGFEGDDVGLTRLERDTRLNGRMRNRRVGNPDEKHESSQDRNAHRLLRDSTPHRLVRNE